MIEKAMQVKDTLNAFGELAKKLKSPVSPPQFDVGGKVSVKDGISEDSASNRNIYKLDVGLEFEAGLMGEIPLVSASFVAVPPPLLEVTIFVPVKMVVGTRLSGIAEYRRDLGWVNAIYPQAEFFGAGVIGVGARGSILSGAVDISGQGTTTLKVRTQIKPTMAGKTLTLDGDLQAEVGGLTFEYKVGVAWGLWESVGSWKVFDPIPVPDPAIPYNIKKITLP